MPCDIPPKITGSCEAKHPAACCSEAPGKGSSHLSPAQAEGRESGLVLRTSVATKEDEVVKRKRLRQTDTPAVR